LPKATGNITAFILLICIFCTVSGYHFIFQVQIREAKAEMKEFLRHHKSSDVTELVFTSEELSETEWENDHEFLAGGRMYDLVSKEIINGKVHIRCIPDHKETSLVNQFMKSNSQQGHENLPLNSVVKLATSQFLPVNLLSFNLTVKELVIEYPTYKSPVYLMNYPVLVQPPRHC
jgi:hypothetical protein